MDFIKADPIFFFSSSYGGTVFPVKRRVFSIEGTHAAQVPIVIAGFAVLRFELFFGQRCLAALPWPRDEAHLSAHIWIKGHFE